MLDKNTGLVWEQRPGAIDAVTWDEARSACLQRIIGTSWGWQLPLVMELKSVQDSSVPRAFVPTRIFLGIPETLYWSATTNTEDPGSAWVVIFELAETGTNSKIGTSRAWCVRGGMNADTY